MARIQRRVTASNRKPESAGRPSPLGGGAQQRTKRKVPLKHLTRFTRLLATLTEAGLPILRNLNILADQWPAGKFRDTILDTADLVEEGQPLSEALEQHPEAFDDLFVNMARAGEAGGVLDQVLNRLADFMDRSQDMRDRTRGAATYPIVIFLVATAVISGLMVFVVPKFRDLFTEMNLELPGPTKVLIAVSDFMVVHWWVLLVPVLFFFLYQYFYFRAYGFRRWNHAVALRLPLLGSLIKTGQTARFATTFGTLVASGVPHLRAFDIVSGALGSEV
ncbi:MAG: type II secretion system F family protein, partial [Planctomycetes bacterium]|nr:type II secretion system F family protein [Planctomycetota bacterium]